MEARRRLALLSSHLRPIIASPENSTLKSFSCVSDSNSASSSDGDKGTQQQSDCVFCQIIRGESPAFKLYEDDICLCILDKNPAVGAMCSKVPFISNAVMKATGCDSFNLLVNNGAAAGQVIFHTHLHIIPRKARDCLWTSESLPRRPLKLDQETSGLADRIRKELLFSDNSEYSKGQGSSLFAN